MSKTVLVVDDEKNIVQLVRLYLANEGYKVDTAYGGREALEKVRQNRPSLVVLDLMMPEVDGWEVCRQLRKEGDIPIIILTARDDAVDKIVGLELGADDYVTKPFNPRELVARVKAVLRRSTPGGRASGVLEVGNIRIDRERREVTVAGRPVALRPKEFDLLVTFATNPGVVYSREQLLSTVWGYDFFGDSRAVDVRITWLRQSLAGGTAQIQSVRGVGYKLVVTETEDV